MTKHTEKTDPTKIRRRIGAKKQHASLIESNGTTASWKEWDKMPYFWDMGPEKMINNYEQFFEAALIRLGLPIVGVSMFEEEEQRLPGGLVIKRRRLPDEILVERRQLADEFIQEHNIGPCYTKPLRDIYLQCDERGAPKKTIMKNNKALVMELISKAAPANDYETARQAAEALFEAREAKSSLKGGNESGALVRALVLASRVGLFVTAEMQLGYLSGGARSEGMVDSNIDVKNARAEIKEMCWPFYKKALDDGKTKNNAYEITKQKLKKEHEIERAVSTIEDYMKEKEKEEVMKEKEGKK